MLKIFRAVVVVFVMFVIVSVPSLIYLVRVRGDSFVGQKLKSEMVKYPWLVESLNLDEPADGKYLYMESQKPAISVSIVSVNSMQPDAKINDWMGEIMNDSVKKEVDITAPFDLKYEKEELLADDDLVSVYKLAKEQKPSDLYLIYVSSYAEKPTSVGLVINRDAIFIFGDAINNLSEKGYIKDILEKTTIMHEWGHLLGVDHVNKDNCIMNEKAEVYDSPPVGKSLPTKYCWEELELIDSLMSGTI